MAFVALTVAETDANSPGSTDLFTKIKDNFDDLDARQRSMVLIENREIATDTTDTTFTGLDGDVDQVYRIIGKWKRSTGGGTVDLRIQPNAIATNQETTFHTLTSASSSQGTTDALLLASNVAIEEHAFFDMLFWANRTIQTVAWPRFMRVNGMRAEPGQSAAITGFETWGFWDETATKITSLKLLTTVASEIRKGSAFSLYRLKPT